MSPSLPWPGSGQTRLMRSSLFHDDDRGVHPCS
jgi:hypothetical protein